MNPLRKAHHVLESTQETHRKLLLKPVSFWATMTGLPEAELTQERRVELAAEAIRRSSECEVWMNDTYTVSVWDEGDGAMGRIKHLSIKRNDRAPVTDWRDKQQIKNQLCGPEAEGIEIYPAESRVVDTANQYHVWVFLDMKIPVGFERGVRMDAAEMLGAGKQRPL
jgi:hypothetical protein